MTIPQATLDPESQVEIKEADAQMTPALALTV